MYRKLTLEQIDSEIKRYKLLIEMLKITIEGYNKILQTMEKQKEKTNGNLSKN